MADRPPVGFGLTIWVLIALAVAVFLIGFGITVLLAT